MKYLSLALMPEGPTDASFLWNIVYRTAYAKIAESHSISAVIGENPFFIRRGSNEQRAQMICDNKDAFDIFILHFDASKSQRAGVLRDIYERIAELAARICDFGKERLVPLVTTREMESWALADPNAIAAACGYDGWPASIEIGWNHKQSDRIPDPKKTLNCIVDSLLNGNRKDRATRLHGILEQISSSLDLTCLSRLESYQEFEALLEKSLMSLRFIDPTQKLKP